MSMKTIFSLLFKAKTRLIIIILCSIIIIVSSAFLPNYLGACFLALEKHGGISFHFDLIILTAIFILKAVFKLIRNQLTFNTGNDIVYHLRMDYVNRMFQDKNIKRNQARDYSILSNDIPFLSGLISYKTFMFLENVLIFLFSLIGLIKISVFATVLVVPFLILLLLVSITYNNRMDSKVKKSRFLIDTMNEIIFENIKGQKTIRSLNAQNSEYSRFEETNNFIKENAVELNKVDTKYISCIDAISYTTLVVCLTIASIMIKEGYMNLNVLVVFHGYMLLLFDVVKFLGDTIRFFSNSRTTIQRISENIEIEESQHSEFAQILEEPKEILLNSLTYSYLKKEIIKKAAAVFEKGNITVITGELGAGKSTLLKIIIGLEEIKNNEIFIGYQDLSQLDIISYRKILGYVPQETVFFHDTLLNNLLLGRTDIPNDYLNKVIDICQATEIIKSLDNQLDTEINRDLTHFSGGEVQRLSMVRALINRPKVLVIDDSFTAIDGTNRKCILDFLKEYKKEAIIVISSNLEEVIKMADCIYDLKNGSLLRCN